MSSSAHRGSEPPSPEHASPGHEPTEPQPTEREPTEPQPTERQPTERQPTEPDEIQGRPETYEAAAARIEQIIRRLDSGEASLNETLELVREGKALIELCAAELQAVAGALEELRLEELVERLEGEVSD
jgi:exodeoxyribonuclease VII small subunit